MLIGNIIGNVINFVVIGLVCFFFAKAFIKPKPA
jgi:large-conductance mechanosensitive channel